MSDISSYLDQRLPSIAEEGLKAAKKAVLRITSIAAGNNQLGQTRMRCLARPRLIGAVFLPWPRGVYTRL